MSILLWYFAQPPCLCHWGHEIKEYSHGVASSGIMFVSSFMKICPFFEIYHGDTHTDINVPEHRTKEDGCWEPESKMLAGGLPRFVWCILTLAAFTALLVIWRPVKWQLPTFRKSLVPYLFPLLSVCSLNIIYLTSVTYFLLSFVFLSACLRFVPTLVSHSVL